MRKLIKLAVIAFGIRAAIRWWKSRQAEQGSAVAPTTGSDPAEELRQKLAESREDDIAPDEPTPPASVAERRTEVHEQGRAALDEMKSSDEA